MSSCAAPGCARPVISKFSRYCPLHRARLRRHGAVDQTGITKAELAPYLRIVHERIAANTQSPAWGKLEARWSQVINHAGNVMAAFYGRRVGIAHEVTAAEQVLRLSKLVEPRKVLETAAAMVLMQQLDGRRFRSDNAFRVQVCRRVRGLTERNAATYEDPITGRTKRVYSELSPRAAVMMGAWIIEAFGIAGMRFAAMELQDREARAAARRSLAEDLEALK